MKAHTHTHTHTPRNLHQSIWCLLYCNSSLHHQWPPAGHFVHILIVVRRRFLVFANIFFLMFVCNSTTVPLWSTSVSLPCCSMCTCTTPLWACAAGWTPSWLSSLACRLAMLPSYYTWLLAFIIFEKHCRGRQNCGTSLEWHRFFTQVLRGDLKPAIETHEMLYQVTKQHKFLPEVKRKTALFLLFTDMW